MRVWEGSVRDSLSRRGPDIPEGIGFAHMITEDLWKRARVWAAANGHDVHSNNVQGVAPL